MATCLVLDVVLKIPVMHPIIGDLDAHKLLHTARRKDLGDEGSVPGHPLRRWVGGERVRLESDDAMGVTWGQSWADVAGLTLVHVVLTSGAWCHLTWWRAL